MRSDCAAATAGSPGGCEGADQDFGGLVLPPIFSHVPLATYFHETGSLSTVL